MKMESFEQWQDKDSNWVNVDIESSAKTIWIEAQHVLVNWIEGQNGVINLTGPQLATILRSVISTTEDNK